MYIYPLERNLGQQPTINYINTSAVKLDLNK